MSGRQDQFTHSDVIMDLEHQKIHAGEMWKTEEKITLSAGVTQYYLLDVGTLNLHAKPISIVTSADKVDIEFYDSAVVTANGTEMVINNHNRKTEYQRAIPTSTFYKGPTPQLKIVDAGAGGNFANQPAGDAVTVVSDNANDVGQVVTIYGTITGATTTITSATLTLAGTDAVTSAITTWQKILGVELSAVCEGTITIAEASGSAEIISITTGDLSAGVATLTGQNANGVVPYAVADDATTKYAGIIGVNKAGTTISNVTQLSGSTPVALGTAVFYEITKVFIGDVESTRTVDVTTTNPGLKFSIGYIPGATGVGGTRTGSSVSRVYEYPFSAYDKVLFKITNGSSGANTIYWEFTYYYEDKQ